MLIRRPPSVQDVNVDHFEFGSAITQWFVRRGSIYFDAIKSTQDTIQANYVSNTGYFKSTVDERQAEQPVQ